ncbi:pyridoxamine 5'-phosphate oxidase family protein [Natrinema sp. 1APR25-10V2]|uniref:pyridoxamine 5'-phosphate oxidase family protein n=1 Tax=Natrinema sp. 1APR25-10V2 TaxID=2951081 RepID=UPI0028755E51|nr:pyridoxamine 5'-phosphate oxidase family protein [Natrinema sp. 1APR25-10V2]MDS0477154.1 pyridoxamine 5'-phosphate oxidase family protein [Natrinema sp. 1APR25-10V2]
MSVDELQEYGLEKMSDTEIRNFLSSQKTGVLGLPEEDAPYLLPLTFGYDGETRLYFTFLLGSSSRKRALSEAADAASFLVFKVDTMYNWESALLRGSITAVPESEWDSLEEVLSETWRPELFDTATLSGEVSVYEFSIDEQTGIKHQGLPPALRTTDESQ